MIDSVLSPFSIRVSWWTGYSGVLNLACGCVAAPRFDGMRTTLGENQNGQMG